MLLIRHLVRLARDVLGFSWRERSLMVPTVTLVGLLFLVVLGVGQVLGVFVIYPFL